jgi:hypothetical protein
MPAGSARSKAPNIDAAISKNRTLIPTTTHVLCSTEPNALPVTPAKTPSGTNMATMPSTNAADSNAPCSRLRLSRAPNTLTVTATIG